MAINNKDDYGKLTKLLYPSIEASGNVYYGQTKKLTMDEILGKNELNFESHIESFKQGHETYKSYFNWRLGPLHGSIEVVPVDNADGRTQGFQLPSVQSVTRLYKDGTTSMIDIENEPVLFIDGTIFIKYRIALDNIVVEQLTNSGSFPIYETSANCELSDVIVTEWFDPSNVNSFNIYDIENRNFFIEESDGEYYLYIQLMSDEVKSPNVVIDITEPLTFTALQPNSTVEFVWNDADDYEINKYDGYGWVSIPSTDFTVTLTNINDKVSIRYSSNVNTETSNPSIRFTGSIKASGNIASLITNMFGGGGNNMINFSAINFKFAYMFANQTALTDVSELYINISGATTECCSYMFYNCSNIIYPPKLIASVTASSCFEGMFSGCTKLRYAPELPAMSITDHCYYQMFSNCTSLYSTPYLPATSMRQSCYDSMFSGCTGLHYAMAILPAKSLNQYCYSSMFSGCTNLKIAPILPAVSTPLNCYSYMFSGCSSLSYVCCLIGNNLDYPPTIDHWLDNVSDSGKLLITNDAPQHLINSLPQDWQLIRLNPQDVADINNITVSHPKVGFNCKLSNSEEPDKYYYVITSGADSTKNGRGKLNNTTTFNMLETNPILSDAIYDACDLNNGNSNQEIWGYKCFNSPVSFRNGVYGECASLITSNPNCDSLNIRLSGNNDVIESLEPAYSLGAKFICAVHDDSYLNSPLSQYNPCSTIELYHSSVKEDSYNSDTDGNYKACVSQAGIIASNKYSDISNFNRYIDANAASGNDYGNIHTAAVITSASVCPVTNMSTEVVGYSEAYTTSITAGETQILLQQKSDNDDFILESTITVYANEIVPLNNSETSLGNENTYFSDVYANYFHGELPSLKRTNNVLSIDEGAIVMIAMKNEKADSDTTNIFTDKSYKYRSTPITFKAVADASTVKLIGASGAGITHTFMYSLNDSAPTSYTDSTVINLNSGDTVSFICNQYWSNIYNDINFDLGTSGGNYYTHFEVHGDVKVYGNLISVLDSNFLNRLDYDQNAVDSPTSGPYGIFARLFWGGTPGDNYCDGLTDARDLVFPEHGIPARCFEQMFQNCTNLAFAPNPGTRTAYKSHYTMFGGCTSLNNLIVLPAYTAYESCYENMFYGCTALAKAPIILAGALAPSCCESMFYGCESLKIAPSLFAVTLETDCYRNMFDGCTSLQYAKCNFDFDPLSDTSSVINMFRDTNATGTLWLSQSGFNNSAYFLPNDWTAEQISSKSIRINAGSTIAVGDYINQDGTPHNYYYADAPFNRIEQISIVHLTSNNNNIGTITHEFNNLMYDYSYKLLTSCSGESIGTIYALAMRVE